MRHLIFMLALAIHSACASPTAESGLSSKEIDILHIILRNLSRSHINDAELKIADQDKDILVSFISSFASDPARIAELKVEDRAGSARAGLVYDSAKDNLAVVDRAAIKGITSIKIFPTDSGYGVFIIEGCELFPFEILTRNGLPYTICLYDLSKPGKQADAPKTKG